MIATSGFLTASDCTKFVFGQRSPKPSSWIKGVLHLRERGGEGRRKRGKGGHGRRGGRREREGSGREGKRGEGKGEERRGREEKGPAPFRKFLDPPLETQTR